MSRGRADVVRNAGVRRAGISERLVSAALGRMPHGHLLIEYPDGLTRTFGSGTNPLGSPWGTEASIRVLDERFFRRILLGGDLGFAESWMAGEWESDDLAEVLAWFVLNASEHRSGMAGKVSRRLLGWLGAADLAMHRARSNSRSNSRRNIAAHYDLSNEFFSAFLDDSMTYSSALFRDDSMSLEEAQKEKFRRICSILDLRPGDRVLEIGGGWGSFARYAASTIGCTVTSITISERQYAWAAHRLDEEGLLDRVDLQRVDYRDVRGEYDKIVSIEMIEAVGHDYYETFFRACDRLLARDGRVALQAIICPDSRYDASRRDVDFIQKHIFPGGQLPSIGALVRAASGANLWLADLFDLGASYGRTLEEWSDRFDARRGEISDRGFDESFLRKWHYYFMYCLAGFRMRHVSVVQMLMTRPSVAAAVGRAP